MANLDYQYLAGLVTRAQVGDSDAFAELYAATYQQQYQNSLHYLRDEYLAQDAMQETYILALKNISKLREPKVFVSWLNQINSRVCYDMSNRKQMQEVGMDRFTENYLSPREEDNSHVSPEVQSIQIDQKQYIINQVMGLPYPESDLILMRYYKNMKIDDIAKTMGISQSSVKRHILKGQKALAKLIER